MSKIFVETRGRLIDYRFLVGSPSEPWWREYRDLTIFEYPTLIIENKGKFCRIYLSGIPSTRKDRVQTIIRYTLVIEIDSDSSYQKANFIDLIAIWLDEVGSSAKFNFTQSQIGNLLDQCFSIETLEELMLVQYPESSDSKKFDNRLNEFITKLAEFSSSSIDCDMHEEIPNCSIWWGGVRNNESRKLWMSLAAKLLKHEVQGKALFLNLATEDNLRRLISKDQNENIGLLIDSDNNLQRISFEITSKSTIPNDVVKSLSTMWNDVVKSLKEISSSPHSKSIVILTILLIILVTSIYSISPGISGFKPNEYEVVNLIKACPEETKILKALPTQIKQDSKLTTQQLANKFGVSKDAILSEVKKCRQNFKKWSATFGKGIWDFEVNSSMLFYFPTSDSS